MREKGARVVEPRTEQGVPGGENEAEGGMHACVVEVPSERHELVLLREDHRQVLWEPGLKVSFWCLGLAAGDCWTADGVQVENTRHARHGMGAFAVHDLLSAGEGQARKGARV